MRRDRTSVPENIQIGHFMYRNEIRPKQVESDGSAGSDYSRHSCVVDVNSAFEAQNPRKEAEEMGYKVQDRMPNLPVSS